MIKLLLALLLYASPKGIHQGIEYDPKTTSVVSWYTDSTDVSVPAIEINGDTTYGYIVEAEELGSSVYKHVIIEGLDPGTTYDACIVGGSEISLNTFEEVQDTVTFTIYGDQGLKNDASSITHATALATDAQMHFVVGDLTYANDSRFPGDPPTYGEWWWETWDRWFDMSQKLAMQKPMICAMGNHEYAEDWESGYEWQESATKRLHQPGNKKYFLLRIPPVAILVLDSCRLESRNKITPYSIRQGQWLKETLESLYIDEAIKWRVAMFHHPIYTPDPVRPGNAIIKKTVLPLMEDMDIDIIFTGHHHIYSRSYPIINDVPYIEKTNSYFDPTGIIHIITGGAGRGLGEAVDNINILKHAPIHHFMYVKITNNKMIVRAIDKLGNDVDYFEISK